MVIFSNFEDEQHPHPQPPSPPPSADEEALVAVLDRKGLTAFLEMMIDLVFRRSEFFKDAATVCKVMTVVSATKARADAEVSATKAKEEDEVKKKGPAVKVMAEAEVQKPLEMVAMVEAEQDLVPSAKKVTKDPWPELMA